MSVVIPSPSLQQDDTPHVLYAWPAAGVKIGRMYTGSFAFEIDLGVGVPICDTFGTLHAAVLM